MSDELVGKRVGGYEIIEVVGRGGMAVVYRAHQISMNRVVAIKILPRQFLNDETYMQRFNREVRIVAQLEHRNIVPVHDYGEFEEQPYIVMRFMDGGSVDDEIRRSGMLPMARMLDFVTQIAPALDYAHSKGVLHRDLKPSNILLDDDGGAYLTDFGIARLMGDASAGMSAVTTHGVIGTPSYMSPEQAQGKPMDGRSDLYALGVSMFEMATGARPFEGDTPYSIAVLQVTAQPPSPRTMNSSIPPAVERVILKAMNKQPENRYPTAVALAEALSMAVTLPYMPDLDITSPSNAASLMDTQPGFRRPEMPPPLEVQSSPPVGTPPMPNFGGTAPANTPSTGYVPPPSYTPLSAVIPRPRRRPRGSLLTSVLIGAVIGCGLLTILAVLAALVINSLTSQASPTATRSATAASALASSTPMPNTVVPSRTSVTGMTQSPTDVDGGESGGSVSPVGARATPTGMPGYGSMIFFSERDGNFDIYRLDLATRLETRLTNDPSSDMYGAISPDGRRVAFQSDRDGDFEIYVMNIDGSGVQRVTNNTVTDRIPAWTPDGEHLVYSSDTRGDGTHDLYEIRPDGSDLRLIYSDGERNSHPRVSQDGRYVIFTNGRPDDASTWDIKRLDLTTNEVVALTNNSAKDWSPTYTPTGDILYLTDGLGYGAVARMDADGENSRVIYDGRGYEWGAQENPRQVGIVFNSDVSGRDELYLMDTDGSNVRQLTFLGGAYGWWLP